MKNQQVILALLAIGATVLLGGCMLAAVGAGAAGTVAYVKGDLEAVEAKKLDTVYDATKKALKQLELSVSVDTKDKISATIIARDSSDKKITVKLSAATEDSTNISIRFGAFGNETKSGMVLDKIKENLK
jgi:outer membrane receptor protein involved in Fe transport